MVGVPATMTRDRSGRAGRAGGAGAGRAAGAAPGAGEVLIRVAAAGVNRPDVMQRKGRYPPPPGAPSIPGLEVAGEIVALGGASSRRCSASRSARWSPAAAMPNMRPRRCGQCLPVPDALTMVEAAALPETLFTVWTNLFERAYAERGRHRAGPWRHQRHRHHGDPARQVVRADDDRHRRLGREVRRAPGARRRRMRSTIETEDFVARGEGDHRRQRACQAVLDMVGGDYLPRNIALPGRGRPARLDRGAARREGRDPDLEVMRRRLTLTGSTLRARDVAFKALVADELAPHRLAACRGRAAEAGDRPRPFRSPRRPRRTARMEAGDHVGKIVLKIGRQAADPPRICPVR